MSGDVDVAQTMECVDGETSTFHAATRFCRHMGPDEKSLACGICKLVCLIQYMLQK